MRVRPTHYELLGVGERSTAAQIRSAYIRLVKTYHPDASKIGESSITANVVQEINRCYATLKDPLKRAAYDAELHHLRMSATQQAPPGTLHHVHDRSKLWITATILVSAFVAVLVINQLNSEFGSQLLEVSFPHGANASPLPVLAALPSASQIEHQTRLAALSSVDDAVSLSEKCFDRARQQQSGTAVELCIVFDDAELYWKRGAQEELPPYFDDQVVTARHMQALSPYEDDVPQRLEALRHVAFKALLAEVSEQLKTEVQRGSEVPRQGVE